MKRIAGLVFTIALWAFGLCPAIAAVAPDSTQKKDTTAKKPWTPTAIVGLNASQMSLTNWSQGGDNSVTWSVFSKLGIRYDSEKWAVANRLNFAFGMSKIDDSEFRNNDNDLFLESVLTYKMNWELDPFFSNSFRTLVANGYDYKQTPIQQTAAFCDPAYLTQSVGFAYNKIKGFTTRLGVSFQEIFTDKFLNYTKDPITGDSTKRFRLETGIESVTTLDWHIEENVMFATSLKLFGRFRPIDIWDVRWENTLTARISKYFNVNLNAIVLHIVSQSVHTQVKQTMQLGIVYSIY